MGIVTNGARWHVYHLSGGLPIEIDLVLDVDLLGEETGTQKANQLFFITRESLRRHQIHELWETKRATSPKSLAATLGSETVVAAIRRELWRRTGQRPDPDEIARLLRETVIRDEALDK